MPSRLYFGRPLGGFEGPLKAEGFSERLRLLVKFPYLFLVAVSLLINRKCTKYFGLLGLL